MDALTQAAINSNIGTPITAQEAKEIWPALIEGENAFIITPGYFYTGRVVRFTRTAVLLKSVSIVFDLQEKLQTAFTTGKLGVVRSFPPDMEVAVEKAAIVISSATPFEVIEGTDSK